MKKETIELIKDFVFSIVSIVICSLLVLLLSVIEETNQLLQKSVCDPNTLSVEDVETTSLHLDSIVTETIVVNPVIEVPVNSYEDD